MQDEVLNRKDRFAKSLLGRAKFRTQADLEDWDQSFDRGVTKQKLKELSHLSFFNHKENLIVLGRTGEGKTRLAISLGRRLCQEGFSTAFLSINILFEEILAAKAAARYLSFLKKLRQTHVLILDDFGLSAFSRDEGNTLIDILEDRSQKGPVIVTSQVDPKGWTKLFADPVIAEAIVDRLLKLSQKITLKGGSYRDRLGAK